MQDKQSISELELFEVLMPENRCRHLQVTIIETVAWNGADPGHWFFTDKEGYVMLRNPEMLAQRKDIARAFEATGTTSSCAFAATQSDLVQRGCS